MELDLSETLKHAENISNYVRVDTIDGKTREGWLSTIDPCSGNLLLLTFRENKKIDTVHLIIANAVSKITVMERPDDEMKAHLRELFSSPSTPISTAVTQDVEKKKTLVLAWLKKNFLPVKEEEENHTIEVMNSVTIHPPYGPDNCICSNEILLGRIQQLLNNVPESEN